MGRNGGKAHLILSCGIVWWVSVQLHAPTALLSVKAYTGPTGQLAVWVVELVWTRWRIISLPLSGV